MLTSTVSRCCTRGESEDRTGEKAHKKGSTLALKPRPDITQIPKQGYQWPHEKDLCPPKKYVQLCVKIMFTCKIPERHFPRNSDHRFYHFCQEYQNGET